MVLLATADTEKISTLYTLNSASTLEVFDIQTDKSIGILNLSSLL